MALWIRHTHTRFPTNSLYTPMDNTPLQSISSVCHRGGADLYRSTKNSLLSSLFSGAGKLRPYGGEPPVTQLHLNFHGYTSEGKFS